VHTTRPGGSAAEDPEPVKTNPLFPQTRRRCLPAHARSRIHWSRGAHRKLIWLDKAGAGAALKVKTGFWRAILQVPLTVGNTVIGVLAVDNQQAERTFSERSVFARRWPTAPYDDNARS
jgi:hypothetical protein